MKLELCVTGRNLPTEEKPGNKMEKMEASWHAMLHECEQCAHIRIVGGDYETSASKTLLSLRIPFFKDSLDHDTEKTDTIMIPPEISRDTLKLIISYAYFVQPMVTMENAQALLEAAGFFRIEDLGEFCDRFIAKRVVLTLENCIKVQSCALVRSAKCLAKTANQFMAKHFVAILDSDGINRLSLTELESILSLDEIEGIPNEERFWEVLEKWVTGDEQNRRKFMPQLIKLLRLPSLNLGYIHRKVVGCPHIDEIPECRKMMQTLMCFKTDPNNSEFRKACAAQFKLNKRRGPQQFHIDVFVNKCGTNSPPTPEIYVLQIPGHKLYKLTGHNIRREMGSSFWDGIVVRNRVYCVNGNDSLTVYNPITKSWLVVEGDQGRPTMRRYNGMLASTGEELFFCCVNKANTELLSWQYDPEGNSWKKGKTVPMEPEVKDLAINGITYYVVAIRKDDTELMCYFGCAYKEDEMTINFMQLVNSQTGESTVGCPMPSNRLEDYAVASYDGKIIVAGGHDNNEVIGTSCSTVEMYDATLNEWCSLPDMIVPRADFALVVANECVYAIGGTPGQDQGKVSIEYLDLNDVNLRWQPACDSQLFGDARIDVCFAVACLSTE